MKEVAVGSPTSEWRANWPVVVAGTVGMSLASLASYSIGVMIVPIEEDLGWSRAQISSGPAVVAIVMICLSSIVGAAVDKLGARMIGIASASLICAALALLSTTTGNPWTWWSIWALLGVAGSAMPTVWTAPVSRIFNKNRGLALGIVLSGSSIGAIVVPPLTGVYILGFGWRLAYVGLAATWAIIALPLIILFLRSDSDGPARPRREEPAQKMAASEALPGVTARQGFRTPAFYKIALGTLGGTFAGTALVMNLVPILSDGGIPLATAASVASLIGISMLVGRITGGYLLDRFDPALVAGISSLAPIVFCLTMVMMPGSIVAAMISVVIYGLTAGPKIAAVVYLIGKYLGQRSFGVLFGSIQALIALGAGIGPFVANIVFDITGSYEDFVFVSIPIFVLCSVMFFILGKEPDLNAAQCPEYA